MIKGLAHVCFVVRNLDASIDFYQNKLGLTLAFDFKNEKGERFGVYLHAGGRCFIELFQGDLADRAAKQSFQHICLEVDDIEATVADLKSKGIQVGPVSMPCDNSYQAWFADPDGNQIELHRYTPTSLQGPFLK